MKLTLKALAIAALAVVSIGASAAPGSEVKETFDNGADGWVGRGGLPATGKTFVDTTLGNDAPSLRTNYNDFLLNGLRFYTEDTSSGFIGDFSGSKSITIGLDVDTLLLKTGQLSGTRDLTVEFDDYADAGPGFDYVAISFDLGTLDPSKGWEHLSTTITDTSATALPAGWTGIGAFDANGNSVLPDGVTFADVLAHVDQLAFQTSPRSSPTQLTSFDVAIDNIDLTTSGEVAPPVPEPGTYALMLAGLGVLGAVARKRKVR